jgi:N-acetylneuraminic acid mutarotase
VGGRTVNLPGMPGAAALGVYAYDPVSAQWEEHPALPVRLDQPNVAAVDDKLYVLGGTGVTLIFVYDPSTRAWSEKPARTGTPGMGAAAVAPYGTTIYVAGGEIPSATNTRGMRINDFAAYDTLAGTWETLPRLPEESAYFGAAIIDNVFYTVGGSTEQREVARPGKTFAFDLTARTWTEKAVALDAVSSFACAATQGRLYIVGGIAGATGRINPETQVYDPRTDSWATTTPLDPARFAMGAAELDGKIYVAGGVMQVGESDFVPVSSVDVLSR